VASKKPRTLREAGFKNLLFPASLMVIEFFYAINILNAGFSSLMAVIL